MSNTASLRHLRWDDRGLLPAVVQDAETRQILMVAWMNEEALQRTLETGETWFWSRSRQALWHKGATSGNIQRVREVRVDCDGDTLLVLVDPAGPACHTGHRSCFYRSWEAFVEEAGEPQEGAAAQREAVTPGRRRVLDRLFAVIESRRENPPPGSYTARLFAAGEDEIVKKVGEEAVEVILAAKSQGDRRLIEEMADLVYHSLVLLAARGLTLEDLEAELRRRFRPSSQPPSPTQE